MKSINIFFSLLLISLLSIFTSCTSSSVEHWIDNPTDKEITINIDGADVTIPAKSGINHLFEYGKHTLSYNGSSVNFMVKPSKMKCFINPTQSNYIFYKNMYINEDDERATESYMDWLEKQISSETQIILNDSLQTLSLPFQVVNDLFIEKTNYNWDYYLDEDIPASVVLKNAVVTRRNRSLANDPNYQAGKFQTVKSKIFREADFFGYLKESGIEDKITFPQNAVKLSELPKVEMPEIDVNKIACPKGRESVELALEHWNKWLTLSGGDFAKEYDDYIGVIWQKILPQSLENECYKEHGGDITYKQASGEVKGVINELYNVSFFIID